MSIVEQAPPQRVPRPQIAPEMEGLLAEVLATLDEAVLVARRDGRILYVNAAAEKLTGYRADELACERLDRVLHLAVPPEAEALRDCLSGGRSFRSTVLCRTRSGRPYWASVRLAQLHGHAGGNQQTVVCVRDVTKSKGRYETWRRLALTDELTGIANRRHLLAVAEREASAARAYRSPLGFVTFDVDHFKQVNDVYGHECGDAVLRQIVVRCTPVLRKLDWFGRVGGEEFAIILPQTPLGDAAAVAARMRERIAARPFLLAAGAVPVTASFGVTALALDGEESVQTCLKRADEALYRAKEGGRNAIRVLREDGPVRLAGVG